MIQLDNVYIINLDKDKERLESTLHECKKITRKHPIRIPGVYGKELQQEIINKNTTYFYSKFGLKSAIGCAMSHINTWKKIIENGDEFSLILEDDVLIDDDFASKLRNIKVPEDFYLFNLGCTIGCDVDKNYSTEYPIAKLFIGNTKKVVKINDNVFIPALPLALHGYILSQKGARFLVNQLKEDKIYSHIDAQLLNYNFPRYAVTPQLVYQKDIDISTSNNTDNTNYPILINKVLTSKDSNGVPLDYKMNIGMYEFCNYTVNGFSVFFFLIGLLLGLSGIKTKIIIYGLTVFSLIELVLFTKVKKENKFNIFFINSIVSMIIVLTGYYLIKK